jgi:methylated-DNA-[protein]-cysteine S-methyltransferase
VLTEAWDNVDAPIGPLTVVVDSGGRLVRVWFGSNWRALGRRAADRDPDRCAAVSGQLIEYFGGQRRRFELAIAPAGSDFQLQVWREVASIPYGETRSYGDVAARLGGAAVARAVGLANAANPIPIVIPCHRVVGADGALVGYGGGLAVKAALLRLEGARLAALDQLPLDLG